MQKNKNAISLIFYFVLLITLSFSAHSSQAALNVKDFGAKGDNVTDDTEAIRATFKAAQKKYTLNHKRGDGTYMANCPTRPEIVFPSGRYLISDAIYMAGGVVRGEGEALIIQMNDDKDIFESQTAWRMTISGLTFVKGRNQLQFSNPNIDSGFVLIEQCRFYGASGVAITMDKGSNSTQLKIRDCVFIQPEQALISYTDETNMTDCWITSSINMKDKAVIENHGARMVLEKILGVPLVNGTDQRWVDIYFGNLTCRNFRFGGEGGGFTPVVNHIKYIPKPASFGLGPSIVLDGCEIYALGNKKRACAIYCEELPNGITIRENVARSVPALIINPKINLSTYFKGAQRSMLGFFAINNRGALANELPELLKNPITEGGKIETMAVSPAAATKALVAAVKKVKAIGPSSPSGLSFAGHEQQTEPGKYFELGYDPSRLRLDDFMDGTTEHNSEHLAVARISIGNDLVIMRRTPAGNNWPHVLLKDVVVDLDKYPFVSFQLRDVGTIAHEYAFKAIEKKSGMTLTLVQGGYPPDYRAYNFRKLFNISGVQTFDLKLYYIGHKWEGEKNVLAQPGDYIVLDFIRFEQEQTDLPNNNVKTEEPN